MGGNAFDRVRPQGRFQGRAGAVLGSGDLREFRSRQKSRMYVSSHLSDWVWIRLYSSTRDKGSIASAFSNRIPVNWIRIV